MDKAERETHDFMNVDSFSQLPFIRPAPPPKEKGIRLFGIEFGDAPPACAPEESESADTTTNENSTTNNNLDTNNNNSSNNGESSRRFECHYCCRNFPTSQALGGHQNAHKRERQHAKRQHLQSAMVHGSLPEGQHHQLYGLMNYRFGSFGSSPTMAAYPTWNNNNNSNNAAGRFYGSSSSYSPSSQHLQQPINGSPLSLWRIPNGGGGGGSNNPMFGRERAPHNPFGLVAGEDVNGRIGAATRVQLGGSNNNNGSQNGYVYDSKTSVSDHVSLDLHL